MCYKYILGYSNPKINSSVIKTIKLKYVNLNSKEEYSLAKRLTSIHPEFEWLNLPEQEVRLMRSQ